MRAVVTDATGFLGGHVARALTARGDHVRATYRDPAQLVGLGELDCEPVRADLVDRGALRRALRGVDTVFHGTDHPGSRPLETVWRVNALLPRLVVEAAAAEGLSRVVLTSSVAAIGRPPVDGVADETHVYRRGGPAYADAKHEGEVEALGAAARLGVDLVIVNPAGMLGVPVGRLPRGEGPTWVVGSYLRGRLPAILDGAINVTDVEDVARGQLLAADRGSPGERYILGGYNLTWAELIDRVALTSGVHHPLLVLPRELAPVGRLGRELGVGGPITDALTLTAEGSRFSSRKAARALGYRTRPLHETVATTTDWYLELIAAGAFRGRTPSLLSLGSRWLSAVDRIGAGAGLRAAERYLGRRLIAGT